MAQFPPVKLKVHPSTFDLMMTVLADNAANAPNESVRLGAEDLMEKRMRFSRLYPGTGGDPYASVRMYEKEAADLIWQLLLSAIGKYDVGEEYHKKLKNGGGGHD